MQQVYQPLTEAQVKALQVLNVTALLEIFEQGLIPERQIQMETWFSLTMPHSYGWSKTLRPMHQRGQAACGTVGCEAGWACILLAPSTSVDGHGEVLVNKAWLGAIAPSMVHYGRSVGTNHRTTASQLGRVLLGYDVHFRRDSGDHRIRQLTDRQWIVRDLKKALRTMKTRGGYGPQDLTVAADHLAAVWGL